jgi:hypothetical protein
MVKIMGFMQRQITKKRKWYEIETNCGTWFVDVADIDGGKFAQALEEGLKLDTWALETLSKDYLQYTEGSRLEGLSVREGYGARLSAPGYLDCTEWSVFDTKEEAEAYLDEYYPEDEDGEEQDAEEQED